MSIQLFCSYMDAKSGSVRSSECAEALHEVAGGFAALLAGLFFFAWAGFELAVIAIFAKPFITAGRFISRLVGAEPESELSANQSRRLVGPNISRLRLVALCALVIVLAAFAAVRISAMRQGAMRFTAGSDIERWLPALFTVAVPCWFIISAVLYRLPRHLIAGAIALAGALAGPLLALAWRDSLALAAVVSGVVLIADGLIAKSLSCDPA